MNLQEKALELLLAKDDKAVYEAIAKLTDKQKDIMIATLVKIARGEQPRRG